MRRFHSVTGSAAARLAGRPPSRSEESGTVPINVGRIHRMWLAVA